MQRLSTRSHPPIRHVGRDAELTRSGAAVASAAAVACTLIAAALLMAALPRATRAETIRLERIVPPGAALTYSVNGREVQSIPVPPGRVSVVVTYGERGVPAPRPRAAGEDGR